MTGAAGGGAPETDDRTIRLSDAEIGAHGVIVGVRADPDLDIEVHGVTGEELERRNRVL